jgi:Flp pilus assembly protein CpaB
MDDADADPRNSLRSCGMVTAASRTGSRAQGGLGRRIRRLRRAVLVRRRLLATLLAATAVLAGVRAAEAPPEPTVPVVVAREDLPGGSAVDVADLEVRDLSPDDAPEGTATSPEEVTGRLLAAPVRRGEPVTDVRLVAPGLLDGYPGLVAAPVRVADAAVVALLEVGDRVDLVATSPEDAAARVVVRAAPVVAVPAPGPQDAGPLTGRLLVVAVDAESALELAGASVASVLSVLLSH